MSPLIKSTLVFWLGTTLLPFIMGLNDIPYCWQWAIPVHLGQVLWGILTLVLWYNQLDRAARPNQS